MPSGAERLPLRTTMAPPFDRVGDERLDLFDPRLHVDPPADHALGSNPSATFIAFAVSATEFSWRMPSALDT
jgi:hypothetical protein